MCPAAALRRWGYESRRYKGGLNTETRRTLVDRFFDATSPWLVIRANTAPHVSSLLSPQTRLEIGGWTGYVY